MRLDPQKERGLFNESSRHMANVNISRFSVAVAMFSYDVDWLGQNNKSLYFPMGRR